MNITSVGYFREMVDGSPNDPSIKDYIDKGNDSIIDKVCTYLNSGIPLIVSPGKVLDIIDETKGSAGSPSILTDGNWATPISLRSAELIVGPVKQSPAISDKITEQGTTTGYNKAIKKKTGGLKYVCYQC